uniref:receptor protein serine/threonine kinase n=1 Tax=Plectus sambesii TaxID=2011161 RepID=A0A914V8K4_9BILA
MWIYFIFSALLVPAYFSPIERSHKSIEYLRKTIRDKDGSFGASDLLCNCTSPGCDFALVNAFGEDFKGLCRSDGLCMATVEKEGGIIIRNYLCVLKENMEPPGARLPFVCLNHKDQTHITKSFCCNSSLCNGQAELELDAPTTPSPITADPSPNSAAFWKVIVVVFISFSLMLIAIILYLCYRYHLFFPHVAPVNGKGPWQLSESGSTASKLPLIMNGIDDTKKIIGQLFDPDTTGSGQGGPLLIPRTIANQIELKETIGQGRFGEVIRGEWKGDEVAVKIFLSRDEKAYYREVDVYLTTMMRHPNILHFIGADNKDTGEVTQLWLVTEYHPKGALLEYLLVNTVSESGLCRMVRSLAQGLAFLHCEIEGTHSKPAIAHRDLKSKNILVKKDGSLCIADLGLAVRYHSGTIDLPCNNKVGTVVRLHSLLYHFHATLNVIFVLDVAIPLKYDRKARLKEKYAIFN